MFRRSIKWRFIIPYVLIIMAVTLGLSIYLSNQYTTAYYADTRSSLITEADLMTAELALSSAPLQDNAYLQDVADRYAQSLSVRVTIISIDGKVLAETEVNPDTMVNHLNRPEVQQVLTGEIGDAIRYSATLKMQMMYVAVGLTDDGELVGIVRLAKPLTELAPRVKEIRRSFALGATAAVLSAFLVLFIVANRTTKPLVRLTNSAKAISEGDFSYIPESGHDNEINDLTRAFAHMAERMQGQLSTINTQKDNLARIVDRLMDGIVIVNHEGGIDLINQTARSMFGLSEEVKEGDDFVKGLQIYQLVELWQKTLQTGQNQSAFIDLPGEEKRFFGMTAFLGTVQEGSVLILIQDWSKQYKLEEMRQTFVSNVSHELRTPLTTMKALTETLQECVATDTESAERFLSLMEVEIDKLTQMVLELLELSKIESGRVEMHKRSIKVMDLLIPPVERMRLQAERSRITLSIEDSGELPLVQVDPERMEQVLLNLIHNAIKHTPPGGFITLSTEVTGSEMIIKVKDTGEGIAQKDLQRIFERFYKTDQARSSGGTGLGLAIAKHIVEVHQGKIWVESVIGQGATFYISLPLT